MIFKKIKISLSKLKKNKPKHEKFLDSLNNIDNYDLINNSSLMNEIERVAKQGLNSPEFIFLLNDLKYVFDKNQVNVRKKLKISNTDLVDLIHSP